MQGQLHNLHVLYMYIHIHVHTLVYVTIATTHIMTSIRESVDSLCRDETDAPIT